MDKKEFLCRYHNLKLRIENEDYIDFVMRSKSVPGPSYGDMPEIQTLQLKHPLLSGYTRCLMHKKN